MRVLVGATRRLGDADELQHGDGARMGGRLRQLFVLDHHFGDLGADGVDRVEAGHGLLKDHADVLAPHGAHVAIGQRHQIAAAQADGAARDLADLLGEEAHDREAGDRLARARFTDDGDGLAGLDPKAHAIDRDDPLAFADDEGGLQILDLEKGRRGGDGFIHVVVSEGGIGHA